MTGIYVLTSPRKVTDDPFHYVKAVVIAAQAEQLPNPKHIIVDGTDDDAVTLAAMAPGWTVHRYERPAGQWLGGNKWPYWRLLEIAAKNTAPGDDAVTLEDDLEFAPNALTRMVLLPVPADVALLQFYSGFTFTQKEPHPGLWRSPAAVQGCQAIKFPRATLELLCRWKNEDSEWQKFNESDVALGLAQQRLKLRLGHHLPDIVQHVGDVSKVSHGTAEEAGIVAANVLEACDNSLAGRQSAHWVGPHFDCLRFFARHDLFV